MPTLSLELSELWAIHKYVRRPREQEGQEFDKAFMLRVYAGLLALEDKTREDQATHELECEEADLWQISRLVDMDYCRGGKYTGQSLLAKVMRALTEQPADALWDEAMEVVNHANGSTREDASKDDGAGDRAGA